MEQASTLWGKDRKAGEGTCGETRWKLTDMDPALSPNRVTCPGSPPKAAMLSLHESVSTLYT